MAKMTSQALREKSRKLKEEAKELTAEAERLAQRERRAEKKKKKQEELNEWVSLLGIAKETSLTTKNEYGEPVNISVYDFLKKMANR